MPEISANYLGALRVESAHAASGFTLLTDASQESAGGGKDGFSPVDALVVSLGACALTTMGFYAQNHGLSLEGTTLEINKAMSAGSPRRLAWVELIFTMPERAYSDKDKKSLERAVKSCPVHNSLHPEIEQRVVIKWP